MTQKQAALGQRISKHHSDARLYVPAGAIAAFFDTPKPVHSVDDGWLDDEDSDEEDPPMPPVSDAQTAFPENRSILLPSNLSRVDQKRFGLKELGKKELSLREGQANDALQAIRLGIGEKSFRFRNNLRQARSKGAKTRAWTLINNAAKKLQHHRLIYRQAREAMIQLGALKLVDKTYKELSQDDMRTSTAVQETNARGQRNAELSWIWRTEGLFTGGEDAFVIECESMSGPHFFLR